MTDKKFTDEEIIKNLKFCEDCSANINIDIIDFINRQKSEIERLKKEVSVARDAYVSIQDRYEHSKAEAYKECLTKVKNYIKTHCNPYGKPDFDYDTSIKILNFIGNLLKEMVGEEE